MAVHSRLVLRIPDLGAIIPDMGISKAGGLADALFSRVQQRVLAILFGRPDRSFYANEIMRLAGSGIGAVQRELTRLVDSGLVTVSRIGNQRHYQANRQSPVFDELRGLVVKTVGLVAHCRQRSDRSRNKSRRPSSTVRSPKAPTRRAAIST